MSGVFPNGGVGPSGAVNTIPDPDLVAGCVPLWYSTGRCRPIFDPAQSNAVIAEIINLVNCGGSEYDCNRLDNLCTAVQDLINDTTDAPACAIPVGGIIGKDALGARLLFNEDSLRTYVVRASAFQGGVQAVGVSGLGLLVDSGNASITNPSACRDLAVTLNVEVEYTPQTMGNIRMSYPLYVVIGGVEQLLGSGGYEESGHAASIGRTVRQHFATVVLDTLAPGQTKLYSTRVYNQVQVASVAGGQLSYYAKMTAIGISQ